MTVSLGNCITSSPAMGWLCQERWKVAGRNKAVQDAAFGRNKSLLCSSSCGRKEELREVAEEV